MRNRFPDDSYRYINLIFTGIILAIIAYSFIFSGRGSGHPIPSGSTFFTDEVTPGTGLSRSFSAIVRFQFSEAKALNPYGIRIFLFFLIQLIIRLMAYFLVPRPPHKRQFFIIIDIILTIALFIISFWPFIEALIVKAL